MKVTDANGLILTVRVDATMLTSGEIQRAISGDWHPNSQFGGFFLAAHANWVTEGWLRQQVRELDGAALVHEQFQEFLRWGMLPQGQPDTDSPNARPKWNPDVLERLREIRRLGTQTRALCRRAILIHERWPLPFAELRQAFRETAPTITAPKRKMDKVHAAANWLAAWDQVQGPAVQEPDYPTSWDMPLATGWRMEAQIPVALDQGPVVAPEPWQPPEVGRWLGLLNAHVNGEPEVREGMDNAHFYQLAGEQYARNFRLEELMRQNCGQQAYLQIPKEDRIVLLTVRELALRQWWRSQLTEEQRRQQERLRRQ